MGIQTRVMRRIASLSASFLLLMGIVLPAVPVHAANEDISTVSNKTATIGEPLAITDLSITGDGNDSVTVALQAHHGTFAFGTEVATVTGTGSDAVTINGLRNDVNATLATLTYTPTSLGADTIEVNLGSNITGVIIDPMGGHAYKIVDDNLTWNQARTAAKQLVYGGVQGYLANITSESEDEFIVEHLTGNGWIGASDQGNEGDWKWLDGPEAGTSFWSGAGAINGGQPVLGPGDVPMYNNWNYIEPNNSGNEDCAEYIVGQGWNDLNCDGEQRNYVVEFGAADIPDPVTKQFTITASGNERSITSCAALFSLDDETSRYDTINLMNDIDCAGVPDVHPLFDDWGFQGIFNGNGHTIRNVTIDNEDNTYYVALISQAFGATVSNLKLDNFHITGEEEVGSLIGYAENTNVIDVQATNIELSAQYGYTGGLIGEYYAYTDGDEESTTYHIQRSSATGTLTTEYGSNVGGLIGFASAEDESSLLIEQVYADVDIMVNSVENDDIGGLIGELELEIDSEEDTALITLQDAYSWGNVHAPGNWNVGGLIGRADIDDDGDDDQTQQFIVRRTYASGNVEGYENVGGLIGHFDGLDTEYDNAYVINNNFAMGQVTGDEENYVGSLVGDSSNSEEGTIQYTNNYVDQTRTGVEACVGNGSGGECTPINADGSQPNYFIHNASNAPLNTWDFEDVWVANLSVPPTFQPITDGDSDGISDTIENAGPHNGDANNDGTPDSQQAHVASLIDPITNNYAVLAVDEECVITAVSIAAENVNASQDASYHYPAGLMDFTLDCGEAEFTATITQYYYGVNGDFIVRKYNPNTQAYQTVNSASVSGQTIGGQQVKVASYQVTDGGELDVDGEANGTIVDPVGLAAVVLSTGTIGSLASTGQSQPQTIFIILSSLLLLGGGVALYGIRRQTS